MKKKLMQSYDELGLIPRKCAKSSSTCVDKRTIFGQIGEIALISVQRSKKGSPLRARNLLTLKYIF